MDALSPLFSLSALWLVAVMTPGPDFLVTARVAIAESRLAGLGAAIGIGIGAAIWGAAGFFGIHALFIAAPWAYLGLKLLGGAYLVYLGTRLLWDSRKPSGSDGAAGHPLRGGISGFRLGLMNSLANPKAPIFVASIFAITMPSQPPLALGLLAIAAMAAISLSWFSLVSCLFTTRLVAGAFRRGRRWIDRAAGAIFVLFGAKLIASR